MIKYYCDACGKEIEGRQYKINILCHITDPIQYGGYVEVVSGKSHPVSGRDVSNMLCLPCYNEVMYPLMANIKKIQKREIKEAE